MRTSDVTVANGKHEGGSSRPVIPTLVLSYAESVPVVAAQHEGDW